MFVWTGLCLYVYKKEDKSGGKWYGTIGKTRLLVLPIVS